MYFSTALFTLLIASASVVATPHSFNTNRHQHAAIAKKRGVFEESPASSSSELTLARSVKKRCKPRSALPSHASTPTASKEHSATPLPSSDNAPQNVAPLPSISISLALPDPPKSTPKPTKSKASAPSPAPAPASGGGGGGGSSPFGGFFGGTNTGGDGTFYGTGLGACGITNNDSDFIAAASFLLFDKVPGYNGENPNHNPICGKKVKVTYQGKSVVVTITDRCAGCFIADSLDFSPAAFNEIADPSLGRIHGIEWEFI